MLISKIKKSNPNNSTLFIGTDSETGDTFNFPAEYMYSTARGILYTPYDNILYSSGVPYNIRFETQDTNVVRGFKIVKNSAGQASGLMALKTGVFCLTLCPFLSSSTSDRACFYLVSGVSANKYDVVPNSARIGYLYGGNYADSEIFRWTIKVQKNDVVQIMFTGDLGIFIVHQNGEYTKQSTVPATLKINEI